VAIVPIFSLIVRPPPLFFFESVRPLDYERGVGMTLLYSHDIIYLSFIDFVKPRNYSIL